jgi:hypothetical protein
MSAEYSTPAAVIKSSRTIRKPSNPNQIIFFSGEKNINQDQKTNSQNKRYLCSGRKNVPIVLHTQYWMKPTWWITWSKEMLPPSSPDCNLLNYFTWIIVEIEVNKYPHNTLASLKAKILDVMTKTNPDREVSIPSCKKFWSRIEAVVKASGNFIQ